MGGQILHPVPRKVLFALLRLLVDLEELVLQFSRDGPELHFHVFAGPPVLFGTADGPRVAETL